MATFNMQDQKVTTQYNAETINFDNVHTQDEFIRALLSLQAELNKAIEAKKIPGEQITNIEKHAEKAVSEAQKLTPDKTTLIEHLTVIEKLVTGTKKLVTACSGAIASAGGLF